MTLREQLKTLSNAVGVSGGEQDVRKLIIDAIKPHVEQITVDAMGNVTALRKGTGASSARVMLAAHMDEPGFMVTEIGDNGLISVNPVGPLDLRVLPTKRVLVGASKTPGVILWVPIHRSFGQNNLVEVDHLSIDVGADDKAGTGAKPGDRVAFVGDFAEFGRNLVRGKALDSRACSVDRASERRSVLVRFVRSVHGATRHRRTRCARGGATNQAAARDCAARRGLQ